jgi:CDP-glucose 4,6-dehydratase
MKSADKEADYNFWFGKRVLITGGDGFVAANLANALIERSANVVVVVRHQRPVTTMKLLGIADSAPDIEYSDLSTFVNVQKLCNRHQIDTVFHLAASAIVSDASNAPISTFENNIIPTLNILETARINRIPRVLIASSDKSYGDHADRDDPERIPYKENYSLRGLDVYSASKVCADMISQTYAFQFKLPVIIVRSCNIYGPADLNFTRLLPRTILRLMLNYRPVINEGNASVLREYIFIDDLVTAYLFLAEHVTHHYQEEMPQRGRATYGWAAYNVGSYTSRSSSRLEDCSNIRSVVQVIDQVKSKLGKNNIESVVIPKDVNFIEIPDQYLDSSKIIELGFQTKITFDEGLDKAIEWYQKNKTYLVKLGYKHLEDSLSRT